LWPTKLAHDTLRDLYHSDEHFLKFFKSNREYVDRSFFFFMADHGPYVDRIRHTRLGMYENLNPFLMVLIPSQYRNSSIHHQLYEKANKLMTHFDIHATIVDILKNSFAVVHCTDLSNMLENVQKLDEALIKKLGQFIAEQLNQLLSDNGLADKCQKQFYIARRYITQIKERDSTLYEVSAYLAPSMGVFEVRNK
uniref:Sulfatase domain-containing protein n=1 Tax=Angiostrongylus cantonensis TaxID=6313 RepID=A0A0K0DQS4_ANGCA